MKRSKIIEERRRQVSPEVRERVSLSFQIVDRIHEILVERSLRQKDLALMLGKSEAEISKWMRGTHNFTIAHHDRRAVRVDTLENIHDVP